MYMEVIYYEWQYGMSFSATLAKAFLLLTERRKNAISYFCKAVAWVLQKGGGKLV